MMTARKIVRLYDIYKLKDLGRVKIKTNKHVSHLSFKFNNMGFEM